MKKCIYIFIAFLLTSNIANASTFPYDAITLTTPQTGNITTTIIATSTVTVLAVSMQQENIASQTELQCGTSTIARNYAKDLNQNLISYTCVNQPVRIVKTGNDTSITIITYVPYAIASSTCAIGLNNCAVTGNGTSTVSVLADNMNLENITYIATSTKISDAVSIVQGSYTVPYILIKFILALLAILAVIVIFLFLIRRKK